MLFARGETMNRFSQNLRRVRCQAGLTQQQLADRLHVTRQSAISASTGKPSASAASRSASLARFPHRTGDHIAKKHTAPTPEAYHRSGGTDSFHSAAYKAGL